MDFISVVPKDPIPAVLPDVRFYHLFNQAERVRWTFAEIPWEEIDKSAVSPELLRIVRELAASELTTWSATRVFLENFQNDVDFTQWVAVWLYEETKHPYVLMQWLRCLGENFDEQFVTEGRTAQSFIRSQVGTLVLNILSEIQASLIYLNLSRATTEPVLKRITTFLSGDEARHASSFYLYAAKMIAASPHPTAAKIDALKALYFWLTSIADVKHPVAIVSRLLSVEGTLRGTGATDYAQAAEARMRAMIGNLIGAPLPTTGSVMDEIRRLVRQGDRHATL